MFGTEEFATIEYGGQRPVSTSTPASPGFVKLGSLQQNRPISLEETQVRPIKLDSKQQSYPISLDDNRTL